MILPPGTLLQQMYFGERLRALPPGEFVEIGAGKVLAGLVRKIDRKANIISVNDLDAALRNGFTSKPI